MSENALQNAAWVAGGLFVSYFTQSRLRSKRSGSIKDTGSEACTETDDYTNAQEEQTKKWLTEQLTPRTVSEKYRIKASRVSVETLAAQTQRVLPAGSLVCFYDRSGSLLVSRRGNDEHYLEPVPAEFHKEVGSVSFLPTSAVFVVIRDRMLTGFKVYSGDDHLLQASKSEEEAHRIKRSKFGDSEKWRLTSEGYVNCRWNKPLGMEVKELRCVLVEDMRRYERRHVKDKGAMEEQIQYHVSREQYLGDEISALRVNLDQQEKENETKRQKLHDLQQTCYRLRVDTDQKAAVIAQLENRLSEANSRIQTAEEALDNEARAAIQYKAAADRVAAQSEHEKATLSRKAAQEIERMNAEGQQMRATLQEREAWWRESVEQAERDSMDCKRVLTAVSEERDRLDAALQRISGQMEAISAPSSRRVSELDIDHTKLRELKEILEEAQKPKTFSEKPPVLTLHLPDSSAQGSDSHIAGTEETSSKENDDPLEKAASPSETREGDCEHDKSANEAESHQKSPEPEQSNTEERQFEQSPEQAKSRKQPPSASQSSSMAGLMAPGLSMGSQKLRLFLEDHSPQASSQCSVVTPRIMTSQEFAKAVQGAQEQVPGSVDSSITTHQDSSNA